MASNLKSLPVDESSRVEADLVQLARLALNGRDADISLFLRRLVRRYGDERQDLSRRLLELLRERGNGLDVVRGSSAPVPVDTDTRLHLVRQDDSPFLAVDPIFEDQVGDRLAALVEERRRGDLLAAEGLLPSKSALFVGPPGVGKSLAARWLARELDVPLLTLDLSAVMSSFLGRTGTNVRRVLDYARQFSCVLLLDELDAVAKRRDDVTEIGELKRLVTVLLQEVDDWPGTSVLLAASNHPTLLDPAVWRRFDLVIDFPLPERVQLKQAVSLFLAHPDVPDELITVLAEVMVGASYNDVERAMLSIRRDSAINGRPVVDGLQRMVQDHCKALTTQQRVKIAAMLVETGQLTQRKASEVTGVSRDTIRRHITSPKPEADPTAD
jgi:SpoVK/Ycf46/Vps4 family AAA+-type ATPase